MIRGAAKQVLSRFLQLTGRNGPRVLAARHPRLILCYHRVVEDRFSGAAPLPGLCVGARAFSRQVRFLAEHFRCSTLGAAFPPPELHDEDPRPRAVLTFDDGYGDNHDVAWPILREASVPATIFLVSRLIGSDRLPWYDEFALLAGAMERSGSLRGLAVELSALPGWQEVAGALRTSEPTGRRVHAAISAMKRLEFERVEETLDRLRTRSEETRSAAERQGLRMLRWEEVASMQAGGIEFGSHTATHPILTRIAPDRLQREVSGSRAELEARLGSPVAAFCYPNGDYDARVLRAVRTAGYRLACTTREFPNDATTDRLELNRLPVGPRSGRGWRGVFSGPAFTADLLDMFKRRAGGRAASNRPGSG